MIRRYELTGADGIPLVAWDYAAEHGYGARPGADPAGRTRCRTEAGAEATGRAGQRGPAAGMQGGRRPGALLLHGLLGRASHWAATVRRLAPRYRAIALDQRGHGHSGRPEALCGPDAYAADAIAAVEQLGLAPVTLIGHSTGALTAWQVAARRPDLVAAVVICDMRASALGETDQRRWEDWLRSWPLPFATLGDVRHWFGAEDPWADPPGPGRGDFYAEIMAEGEDGWRPRTAPGHLLRSRELWIRDAHWDELAQVRCPALVVRGPDGELGRAEAQEMVRVLPRGRYAEIPDAGHLVPWDRPEAWYGTVEEFLREALPERLGTGSAATAGPGM